VEEIEEQLQIRRRATFSRMRWERGVLMGVMEWLRLSFGLGLPRIGMMLLGRGVGGLLGS